jgi:hypothetical protein
MIMNVVSCLGDIDKNYSLKSNSHVKMDSSISCYRTCSCDIRIWRGRRSSGFHSKSYILYFHCSRSNHWNNRVYSDQEEIIRTGYNFHFYFMVKDILVFKGEEKEIKKGSCQLTLPFFL